MNRLLVLFLTISVAASAQSKKDLRESSVKSRLTQKVVSVDGNDKKVNDEYEEYDKHGNVVLKIDYNKEGNPKVKTSYKYDKFNKLSEELEINEKEGKITKTSYFYDASNNKVKEVVIDKDGNKLKITEYKYDKNLKIERREYDGSQKLKSIKIYTYQYF